MSASSLGRKALVAASILLVAALLIFCGKQPKKNAPVKPTGQSAAEAADSLQRMDELAQLQGDLGKYSPQSFGRAPNQLPALLDYLSNVENGWRTLYQDTPEVKDLTLVDRAKQQQLELAKLYVSGLRKVLTFPLRERTASDQEIAIISDSFNEPSVYPTDAASIANAMMQAAKVTGLKLSAVGLNDRRIRQLLLTDLRQFIVFHRERQAAAARYGLTFHSRLPDTLAEAKAKFAVTAQELGLTPAEGDVLLLTASDTQNDGGEEL